MSSSNNICFGRPSTTTLKYLFSATALTSASIAVLYIISTQRLSDTSEPRLTLEHVKGHQITVEEYVTRSLLQDDPRILNYIRDGGFLIPPSRKAYDLSYPKVDPSMGQSMVVKQILKNMTNGFFVECGALDGETRSNTLDLELRFGWTGLLVEANPKNFKIIQKKHRRAWLSQSCLATVAHPHQVRFKMDFNVGKILGEADGRNRTGRRSDTEVIAQCFPLYSLLAALGQGIKRVDYLSLDVEGSEFQVLTTIPWNLLEIRVLSVEFSHDAVSPLEIEEYMKEKGYRMVTKVMNRIGRANDLIFVHKSVGFEGKIPNVLS